MARSSFFATTLSFTVLEDRTHPALLTGLVSNIGVTVPPPPPPPGGGIVVILPPGGGTLGLLTTAVKSA